MTYEPRTYRDWVQARDLAAFTVREDETDLAIYAERELKAEALAAVRRCRGELKAYIGRDARFQKSLRPIDVDTDAPAIVREMADAAREYGVGPMAAVAGAVAEYVGRELLELSEQVIVENGGDIFVKMNRETTLGLYAGPDSPFTGKLRFRVDTRGGAVGVCTSSGSVGHSLSFGKADAVVAIAGSTALADAAATALCNRIQQPGDVAAVIDEESERGMLDALIAVIGDKLGVWGDVELVR